MERKTIQINPDFLKFGGKTKTQRNRTNGDQPKPIKMKKPTNENNRTVRRRMINHLRQQQEENYRKLASVDSNAKTSSSSQVKPVQAVEEFKSDFDKSLEYLENVAKKNAAVPKRTAINKTSRSNVYSNIPDVSSQIGLTNNIIPIVPSSSVPLKKESASLFDAVTNGPFQTCEDVQLELPDVFDETPAIQIVKPPIQRFIAETPKYGCLKGGSLPTYRTWKNATQRSNYPPSVVLGEPNTNANTTTNHHKQNLQQRQAEMRAFFKRHNKKEEDQKTNERAKQYLKRKKQKRILKRTYRVGKSKVHPRVSVLVSNKTMRNKIQQVSSKMKNTPIEEVRRYLVKKGLIRVGSTCPNDVLRKMYESTNLLCGELQNHNPDNLLYNYLNNGDL